MFCEDCWIQYTVSTASVLTYNALRCAGVESKSAVVLCVQVIFALNQTLLQQESLRAGSLQLPYTTEDLIKHYNCGDLNSIVFNHDTSQVSHTHTQGFSFKMLEQLKYPIFTLILTEFCDFRSQTSTMLLCRPASRRRLRRLTVTSDRSSSIRGTRGWADVSKPCWMNTRIRASSSPSERVSPASHFIISYVKRIFLQTV